MLNHLLQWGRVTKHLPYIRGLGALRSVYATALSPRVSQQRVPDFDGDLLMDVDIRETIGFNIWHRPSAYEAQERRLLCEAIKRGSVVLDIGANMGLYTLLAAKRGATVFAIEADPQNVEVLRHHVHINGFDDRVTILFMAAMDRTVTVNLFRSQGNSGHSSLYEGGDAVEVPGKTIDSLGLPPIDVCKMDIEGAEGVALMGMRETIRRSPNLKMLIEYNPELKHADGLMEFICERFDSVYAVRKPPFGVKGPLSVDRKPPSFCNLWVFNSGSRNGSNGGLPLTQR